MTMNCSSSSSTTSRRSSRARHCGRSVPTGGWDGAHRSPRRHRIGDLYLDYPIAVLTSIKLGYDRRRPTKRSPSRTRTSSSTRWALAGSRAPMAAASGVRDSLDTSRSSTTPLRPPRQRIARDQVGDRDRVPSPRLRGREVGDSRLVLQPHAGRRHRHGRSVLDDGRRQRTAGRCSYEAPMSLSGLLARKGCAVTFTHSTPGTYDPHHGAQHAADHDDGRGLRHADRGRPGSLYGAQPDRVRQPDAPLHAATRGVLPLLGFVVPWGGETLTVKNIKPLAMAGVATAARIVVSR
jgi:hypothetical protein